MIITKNFVILHFKNQTKMSHKTAVKIYEIASYVIILGATVVFFLMDATDPRRSPILLLSLIVAVFCRWMMERHRFRAANDEIDQLQADLRRLTQLLAEEKKKNKNA